MTGEYLAAVVQTGTVAFDPVATVDKLGRYAAQAAERGARLVVFPEAFVGAHAKGTGYGGYVGGFTDPGNESYKIYYDGAIEVPGPLSKRIGEIAADLKVFLVVGVVQRDRGTLYCTVLFFDDQGDLIGKHQKLMPTGAERLIWGYADGSTTPVLSTSLGRVGAVICWENFMPMLRLHMYGQGVQVYCAPTADHRETWMPMMRHIALEGQCYVLSACQFNRREDFPADFRLESQPDEPQTIISRGGSCIIDPFGNLLAGPVFDEDCILTATIDPVKTLLAKHEFDVVGHSARPDIFSLQVDAHQKHPVTARGDLRKPSTECVKGPQS